MLCIGLLCSYYKYSPSSRHAIVFGLLLYYVAPAMYLTVGDFVNRKLLGLLNQGKLNVLSFKDRCHRNKDHLKIHKSVGEMEQKKKEHNIGVVMWHRNQLFRVFFSECGLGGNCFLEFQRGQGKISKHWSITELYLSATLLNQALCYFLSLHT